MVYIMRIKGALPFSTHAQKRLWQTLASVNKKPNEPSKFSAPIREPVLMVAVTSVHPALFVFTQEQRLIVWLRHPATVSQSCCCWWRLERELVPDSQGCRGELPGGSKEWRFAAIAKKCC